MLPHACTYDAMFVHGGEMQGLNPMRQAAMLRVNNGYQVPTRSVSRQSVLRRCLCAGELKVSFAGSARFFALTRVLACATDGDGRRLRRPREAYARFRQLFRGRR